MAVSWRSGAVESGSRSIMCPILAQVAWGQSDRDPLRVLARNARAGETALECSRFEWIEPDESNGARLRSEATAQRAPFKLQKA